MTRQRLSHEFETEGDHLVTVRSVSVAQAVRDPDIHATGLRCWIENVGTILPVRFPARGR